MEDYVKYAFHIFINNLEFYFTHMGKREVKIKKL